MFTVLILALLLSCVVTYTNSRKCLIACTHTAILLILIFFCAEQQPIEFNVPTPQEQREASSVNSFKKPISRQLPAASNNNNPLPLPSSPLPIQSQASDNSFYNNRQPGYTNSYNDYNNGNIYLQRQPERFSPQSGLLHRPHASRPLTNVLTTQNPSYQQTANSRPEASNILQPAAPSYHIPTPSPPRHRPVNPTQSSGSAYAPVTQFAWRLFQYANPEGQNYVSCPLSPQLLLSYCVSGSEGATKKELLDAVGYENTSPLTQLTQSMLSSGDNRQLQVRSKELHN